ncbi:MAG: ATP-binding protein [Actinobacteria bacterium]|nr:ATP-binding protein [Actinomycetota bacterium]
MKDAAVPSADERLERSVCRRGAIVRISRSRGAVTDKLPLRVLPFGQDSFEWNRFESFCLAAVRAMPDVERAERYGKTGEAQKEIDIEADLKDGRKRTIQCRHRKAFNIRHAEKTVKGTTYEADEHEIWVTCAVGTKVSDYIDGLDGWRIESGEGIGQRIRGEVPREKARLIVADAFGARVSRAFLGPDSPVAFVAPEDFFLPFDKAGLLLRHDLPLVGRQAELRALVDAAETPSVRVVVQPGRGGIGKTRLLRDAARALEADGKRVLFALDGATITAEILEDLPLEDTIVFVDDAQREDVEITPLLATTRRPDPLTVVLVSRPAGLERIAEACSYAGVELGQRLVLPPLGSLAAEDVAVLAEHATGGRSGAAERLADATPESPLITVLGGGLIAKGAFDVDSAEGPAELRHAVMDRFVAEQRGRITTTVPRRKAQELLVLLAALGPLNENDNAVMELVAEELDVPTSKLRRWLGDVQDAGLLLQLGSRRRLTPDVLADEVLFEACVDRQGRGTGRALELWRRYGASSASELLINLGAIDWRLTATRTSLLGEVWSEILDGFKRRDAWGREQLIDLVAPAAVYAPDRILELVDTALGDPATTTNWDFASLEIDDNSVLQKLPALLGSVGRHRDFVWPAMDRLWRLGRDDVRRTSSHADHPLRLLRELGGYDMGPEHHQALIDLVAERSSADDVDDHANSPLDLLGAILDRDGTRTRWEGRGLEIHPYLVSIERTERWRSQVRALIVDRALHGSPRQRVVAAKLFEEALRLPFGAAADSVREEVVAEWHADKLRLLDAIGEIVGGTSDPMVRAALAKTLRRHAEDDRHQATRERAAKLLEALGDDEAWLLGAIAWPFELLDERAVDARNRRLATILADRCKDGDALGAFLEQMLGEIVERRLADAPSAEGAVLLLLHDSGAAYAEGLWGWGLTHPDGPVASLAPMALAVVRADRGQVDEELSGAAASGDAAVRRLAANYISAGSWLGDPTATELQILDRLSRDDDPRVRGTISSSLPRIGRLAPDLALRQALAPGAAANDGRGGDMPFHAVVEYGVDKLDDDQLDALSARLAEVEEPGYAAHEAVAELGKLDPGRVVDLWIGRLRREREEDGGGGYRAVPWDDYGIEMLGEARGEKLVDLLARLIAPLPTLEGWRRRELTRIFWRLVIPGFREDKLDELVELRGRRSRPPGRPSSTRPADLARTGRHSWTSWPRPLGRSCSCSPSRSRRFWSWIRPREGTNGARSPMRSARRCATAAMGAPWGSPAHASPRPPHGRRPRPTSYRPGPSAHSSSPSRWSSPCPGSGRRRSARHASPARLCSR